MKKLPIAVPTYSCVSSLAGVMLLKFIVMSRGATMIKDSAMHERIRFIDHQGEKILVVDFSNCQANEVEEIARAVPDYTTVQPPGSVLVLTDFSGAAFDRDAIRAVKEAAVFDKPFVKKSALIGTEDLPASFYDELTSFSRRELRIFKTRGEALAWLVGDTDSPG